MARKKNKSKKMASTEVVVRVVAPPAPTMQDLVPVPEDGGKYMIPKTWMSEKQVLKMVQRTPAQHIYKRKGRGGQIWDYVTGNYVEKVLNYTFGWNWDFEVVQHGKEQDMVWVLGKLTVKDDKGHTISKSQFGRAEIKFRKDSKQMLDFGNDLKAATTDALKKCASLLGIASDIYGKTEYKEETGREVVENVQSKPSTPAAKKDAPLEPVKIFSCEGPKGKGCAFGVAEIPEAAAQFSKKMTGKQLCRDCYKEVMASKK